MQNPNRKRDKYIDKDAVLTHQLQTHQQIKHLDHLKSQLYVLLDSPFRSLNDPDEDDGYHFNSYIIWQEDKQAEIPNNSNYNDCLLSQIRAYQSAIDKIKYPSYNVVKIKSKPGQLQLRLVF